jgi:CheY-like chemotaxis protein
MRPARVLLVEDDVHTRRINALALGSLGFEIVEAVDGFEALRLALSLHPDLIVMDISLPGMSGTATMERILTEIPPPPPLMLVLTARAMRDDMEAARSAGCDGYLTKPIDPFDLAREVERLLSTRRPA